MSNKCENTCRKCSFFVGVQCYHPKNPDPATCKRHQLAPKVTAEKEPHQRTPASGQAFNFSFV